MPIQSVLTVTTPATVTALVQLSRVKLEFSITGTASDNVLNAKIAEASSDLDAAIGFTIARTSVAETFWHHGQYEYLEEIVLNRAPVVAIDSIVLDGETLDPSRYRLDAAAGLLYPLDTSGYPTLWRFLKAAVINYSGGYLLPGQIGRDLPAGIEGAALSLVQSFWSAKGRDPLIKSEETAGVGRTEYWVGAVGDPNQLPPDVLRKLLPFRRETVA
jgi:hypothetical protein